jgi:hypothetical protein
MAKDTDLADEEFLAESEDRFGRSDTRSGLSNVRQQNGLKRIMAPRRHLGT